MSEDGKYFLYIYDLSTLDSSSKVRIVYSLKGRLNEKGLVEKSGGRFMVPGCFIVPIDQNAAVEGLLKFYNVNFKKREIELLGSNLKNKIKT